MISLNETQHAAVTAPDGPALVLAGAGSGKTRVIVERLAWLIEERGMDPRSLLALTFTNKAAGEMQARVAERLQVERVPLFVGTFHSFGIFLLRREIERLGRPGTFTVFDDADQISLMKRLLKALASKYEPVLPREALSWISALKQRAETPDPNVPPEDAAEETYRVLWEQYHAALLRARAVDFDDLLALPVRLFDRHPEVLQKYQRRFRYVVVDEYQDTNRAQYLLARHLSSAHRNLFVVGDEDQSIYSWRGADINNILDFAADYDNAMVYRLEENYRSTKAILDAANALVAHNKNRLGKNLWTAEKSGEAVGWHWIDSAEDEARFVVEDIQERALPPEQVAVLYRTNNQSRLFEAACRTHGINYIVIGGIKFYSRKEVKDILAYLRLLVNPEDDESLRRVINVPPRGIGGGTMEHIEAYAASRGTSLIQVIRDIESDETLPSRARTSAVAFVRILDDYAIQARQEKQVAEIVEGLLETIGYRDYVRKSDDKDYRDRLDIVEEFVISCKEHDTNEGVGLLQFLQDLALLTDLDTAKPGAPAVTLMTCHSAKGLEFDHVYLAGLEDGMLPFLSEYDFDRDIEEERRLCYVAMTRARRTLTLSGAQYRVLYGKQSISRMPSRFVREIGMDRLRVLGEKAAAPKPRGAAPIRALSPSATESSHSAPAQSGPEAAAASPSLKTGTRVRHAKFGPGYVVYTSGAGDKLKAVVRFNSGRRATLLVSQAPIEILDK